MDVNNYSAKDRLGKIKEKGLFIKEPIVQKGYDKPIIAIALYNYFYNNIPVENTIRNHTDIYDFCSGQKIDDSTFIPKFIRIVNGETIEKVLQKTNRYYVTKSDMTTTKFTVGYIIKEYRTANYSSKMNKGKEIRIKKKPINLQAGDKVVLFNNFIPFDNIKDYEIDYKYYINETNKIINKIKKNE